MPSLPYTTLDVFTTTPLTSGNPLAIVSIPPGTTLTKSQEHLIAREFNYSETVFIYPDSSPSSQLPTTAAAGGSEQLKKIAIWTTEQELPFAGHPTVGTAWYLIEDAARAEQAGAPPVAGIALDTLAGRIPVRRDGETGRVVVEVSHRVTLHGRTVPWKRIGEGVITFSAGEVRPGQLSEGGVGLISIVDGMCFAVVDVGSEEALKGLKVGIKGRELTYKEDVAVEEGEPGEKGFVGAYAFTADVKRLGSGRWNVGVRSRMFYGGDQEDAATGSAACALGSYISLVAGEKEADGSDGEEEWKFEIVQGVEMGRRSDIGVTVTIKREDGVRRVNRVSLVGDAVRVMEGVLTI